MKSYEMKIAVTDEENQTLRENLIQILSRDQPYALVIITLRSGKQFYFPFGVEALDHMGNMSEEEIREKENFLKRTACDQSIVVGKNYIEINCAPGSSVGIYEMVPISEIISVYYY